MVTTWESHGNHMVTTWQSHDNHTQQTTVDNHNMSGFIHPCNHTIEDSQWGCAKDYLQLLETNLAYQSDNDTKF